MLPQPYRLRDSGDFRAVIRRGIRVGRPTLVVHAGRSPQPAAVRVGLVVPKGVGNAVTRNRVKRRLRHLAAGQLERTPAGTDVVLRALPRAATAPRELPGDLAAAWSAALHRLGRRP